MSPLPLVQQLVNFSRHNVIPDIQDIREVESRLQSERERLYPKIREAKSVLDALLVEQARVEKSYQACISLLAPIRKLAPELLSYIFLQCLPNEDFLVPAQCQAPLLFLNVSCMWRNIALSTAGLWVSLRITPSVPRIPRGMTTARISNARSAVIRTWFSRAASLPLSISLDNLLVNDVILNAVIEYSHQCRHLHLGSVRPLGRLHISPSTCFSDLETLHVTLQTGGSVTMLVSPSSFPSLQEIRWVDRNNYLAWVMPPFPALPWGILKRLTLAYHGDAKVDLLVILECLSQCCILEYAEICMSRCNATPRAPVVLPNLTTLILDLGLGRLDIIKYLTVPSLCELTLYRGVLHILDLEAFVRRSMFIISSLTLRRIFFPTDPPTSLGECLLLLGDSLQFLCVVHSDHVIGRPQLDLLTRTSDKQYLCPRLERLHLIGCVAPMPEAFLMMVRSRLQGHRESSEDATLKSLRVVDFEFDLASLQTFRDLGLELIVTEVQDHRDIDI